MLAVDGGDLDLVKVLLAKGADVNAKTESGETALTIASIRGNSDMIRLLKNGSAR
jgi:ankyrin repeat protein